MSDKQDWPEESLSVTKSPLSRANRVVRQILRLSMMVGFFVLFMAVVTSPVLVYLLSDFETLAVVLGLNLIALSILHLASEVT